MTKKNALKLEKVPSLNAIWWKLMKTDNSLSSKLLVTKFYRRLYGGGEFLLLTIQTSLKFGDLAEQYLHSLFTYQL